MLLFTVPLDLFLRLMLMKVSVVALLIQQKIFVSTNSFLTRIMSAWMESTSFHSFINRILDSISFFDSSGNQTCLGGSLFIHIVNNIEDNQILFNTLLIHSSFNHTLSISSPFVGFDKQTNAFHFLLKALEILQVHYLTSIHQ